MNITLKKLRKLPSHAEYLGKPIGTLTASDFIEGVEYLDNLEADIRLNGVKPLRGTITESGEKSLRDGHHRAYILLHRLNLAPHTIVKIDWL